jgi:MFS family permease
MQEKTALGTRFWRLWTAIAASSLGDGIFTVALPLLALRITRSPLAISGILIASRIPVVLAALPVGTLADRVNRRRLIVAIEMTRFVLLGAFGVLILLGRVNLALIYLTAFVMGGLNIAFDVVGSASLPAMVERDNLVRANAHLLNAEMTAENLVGQALGGAAFAVARSLPFIADAASLAASAALLNGAIADSKPAVAGSSAWQDLREGLRWFLGHSLLRQLTIVIASLAFCQGIVLGLLAIYARQQLHLSGTGYGLLLAVAGIGTVIGGLTASRLYDRLGSGPTILVAAVIFGSAYPILAFTHSAVVAAGALLAQEAFVIIGNTASRSLRQRVVPAEIQGRAASANFMIVLSCVPLGALLGGLVAGAFGLRTTFMTAAILQAALLAAAGPRLLARIRALPDDDPGMLTIDLTSPQPLRTDRQAPRPTVST